MDRERAEQWKAIETALEINAEEQVKLKKKIKASTGIGYNQIVKGSMIEFPYLEKSIIVDGVDYSAANLRIRELHIKEQELEKIKADIEMWIDLEPDLEMQSILLLAYRDGLTHQQIGDRLGYERSTVSQKLHRFWNR